MPRVVLRLAAYSRGRQWVTRHDPDGDWRHILRDDASGALPERLAALVAEFAQYLASNPRMSQLTREAYPQRVRAYLRWLDSVDLDGVAGDPLVDEGAAQAAVLAYEGWQRTVARRAASTINAHGTAVAAFYAWRGLRVDVVRHEITPQRRALDTAERRRLDRYVGTAATSRERAVFGVLRYCGLRRSELVGLDVGDVVLSGQGGAVTVRHGKGRSLRRVPVPPLLRPWLAEHRAARVAQVREAGHAADEVEVAPLVVGERGRLGDDGVGRLIAGLGDR
ncbi:integrase/recombinase XerC, partial [Prauserella aidingensis]|nr:integrase/recombinase XerC [Prauserella aidingensis]